MEYADVKCPTDGQCSKRERLPDINGMHAYAIWYPQMGGYAGRAVVVFHPGQEDSCFDVLVWHDGDWPFDSEPPRELHHCSPMQFVDFGEAVAEMQAASVTEVE